MNKEQFKKLQVGDLVEWNNTTDVEWNNTVTTDANLLGIIVGATEFKTTMCENGTTQDSSCHQVRIKWNDDEYTRVYTENDEYTIELIIQIAEAKK